MTVGTYFYHRNTADDDQYAFVDENVPFGARITQLQQEGTVFLV